MFPARKRSWMANGQAYTSPTGSIRHTTRPAPHMFRPANAPGSPSPDRWKNESPVSTRSPLATSQSYSWTCWSAVGCSSSQTSAPRPDGPQPGDAQRGAVTACQRGEFVELVDVVPGHDHGDLGVGESGGGEVFQRTDGHREGPGTPDGVVDLGGRAVQRDLDVDVVAGGQPGGHLGRDPHAVGGELHAHVVSGGVVHQLPKVRPHSRFPAADVDVEHLHAFQLVDDVLAVLRGQLTRIAFARRRQAVHARQVARVGQLPGQADGCVQPMLELLDQPWHGRLSCCLLRLRRHQHVGPGQHAERMQVGTLPRRPRLRRRGRRLERLGSRPAIAPPRGWCGSSGTTVCGCRSDTTAHRKARAAPPPAGATATRDRDRTRPATMRPSTAVEPADLRGGAHDQ